MNVCACVSIGAKLFSGDHVQLPEDEVSVNRHVAALSIRPDATDANDYAARRVGDDAAPQTTTRDTTRPRPLLVETDGEVMGMAPVTVELLPQAVEMM